MAEHVLPDFRTQRPTEGVCVLTPAVGFLLDLNRYPLIPSRRSYAFVKSASTVTVMFLRSVTVDGQIRIFPFIGLQLRPVGNDESNHGFRSFRVNSDSFLFGIIPAAVILQFAFSKGRFLPADLPLPQSRSFGIQRGLFPGPAARRNIPPLPVGLFLCFCPLFRPLALPCELPRPGNHFFCRNHNSSKQAYFNAIHCLVASCPLSIPSPITTGNIGTSGAYMVNEF